MKSGNAYTIYLWMESLSGLFYSMVFTASSVYQVTIAQLSPLQLVLVGTVLELTGFIFKIPTGVVADVVSRKLSIPTDLLASALALLIKPSRSAQSYRFCA